MGTDYHAIAKSSRRFEFKGVSYHFLVWERGGGAAAKEVPLVLLHGFSQSAESWDDIARHLCQTRSVIALDFVGHGESDRPDNAQRYSFDEVTAALSAFLASLASEYTVTAIHVAGYSMGGRVALATACRAPRMFASLALEAAGLGPATNQERIAMAERDAASAACLRTQGVEAFMNTWEQLPLFATQTTLPAVVRKRLRASRLANDAEALARTFEGTGQHVMPARAEAVAALCALIAQGSPVLYVAGQLDKTYRALAEELRAQQICETRIIDGAGHNTHLEAPEAFTAVLEEFLAQGLR